MNGHNDGQPELRSGNGMNDEIDLLELWRTLVNYKRMIIKSVVGAAVLAAGISLQMHNVYHAEVLVSPVNNDDSKGGRLASALGGLGGLASMAGISVGSSGSSEENLAVMQSNNFIWKFVQEKNLMPILFEKEWDEEKKAWKEEDPTKQPGQMDVYRLFSKSILSVDQDKKTNIITVAVDWEDAALAADWANSLVEKFNQYTAQQDIERSERNLKFLNEELMHTQIEEMRKILFDMMATEQKKVMMANTQKEYAFKVLDKAIEPDKKIKPKRTLIVIMAAFVAGFVAAFYAFIKEAIAKRRKQEFGVKTM